MLNRFVRTGWLWLLATVVVCSHAAGEKTVAATEAKAVQTVVMAQLDAFARGDAAKAFSYASPEVRKVFSTPDRFMTMARLGYPALFQPATVTFFKPEQAGNGILQRVQLADAQGVLWVAMYSLQRQPDKLWRITGCTIGVSEGLQTRRWDVPAVSV